MEELSQARLKQLFLYDQKTGVVTRRITTSSRAKAGDVVGFDDGAGYLQVSIAGKVYRLHRVVYCYMTGTWPAGDIDHDDRNRSNNRWKNLLPATRAENCCNKSLSTHNTSGFTGVSWSKTMSQWEARITKNNKANVLGYFGTPQQASAAYQAAKPVFHSRAQPQ
jgi:signal peptidase I